MQIGFIGDAVLISISLIVIVTKTTAKNTPHPTLGILHIRGYRTGFCHHCFDLFTNAIREIRAIYTQDAATQVVTAIDMVADPWETVLSHIGLRVAEDVGIAAACEGVEDTTIIKVDMDITGDGSLKGTTIDKLTLGHVRTVARSTACHTRKAGGTVQVDVGAVFLIIDVFSSFIIFSIFLLAADGTHLTATEDLEHITLVQVDGGTTPNL